MAYRTVDTPTRKTANVGGFLQRHSLQNFANTALKAAAGSWFIVAVIGQLVFAVYTVSFYGGTAVRWDLKAWNKINPHAYVPGDTMGNVAVGTHFVLAVIIILCGAIQLIPQVRKRAPAFHRWNGRVYILTAFTISVGGLYIVWIRGTVGDFGQHLASTFNAALIILCAAMALRYALARKFAVHRRWALRLFMVASGVWFFRIGFRLWFFLNGGPAGYDPKTFTGPFLTLWTFGQFLLPLIVLELYLRTQGRPGAPRRIAMTACLLVLTVAMGVGIFLATTRMWLPRILH